MQIGSVVWEEFYHIHTYIHTKVKVMSPWSWKFGYFLKLSPLLFTKGAGKWPWILELGQISKFDWAGILIFVLVFVSCDFELGRNVSCEESTISPIRG